MSSPIPHFVRVSAALCGLAIGLSNTGGCSTDATVASAATNKPVAAPSARAKQESAAPSTSVDAPREAASAKQESAAQIVTLSAVGDCTLGDAAGSELAPGSFHDVFEVNGKDFGRPFSGVVATLSEDDLTIANLETTLGTHPQRTELPFAFRGRPEFAQMLVKGSVELVNVANNHANDCGPKGVVETLASLDAANVSYFGLGHVDERTIHGIQVVNLGYTGGRVEIREQVEKDIRAHKRPDNLVVVTFHWGIEGEHASNTVQIRLGHASIDAGADLVLGHHPHVLQGIEQYKKRKIIYSLGNFVFGGNAKPAELDSMIYRARFTLKDGKLEPLDDKIIPVAISSNRVQNDFRPVLLAGAEADRVTKAIGNYSDALTRAMH